MSAAGDHLDLDALADVEEGLVDADTATAAEAHLRTCEECGDRLARLRTTRALLSALPADPMPDDVAARVRAALPDEPPMTTVVPASTHRRWRSRNATFAGLGAVAAGVALIAAIAVGALRSGGNDSGGGGGAASGALSAPQGASTASFPVVSTGTTYTYTDSSHQLVALETVARTGRPPSPAPHTPGRATTDSSKESANQRALPAEFGRLRSDRAALLQCVAKAVGGSQVPLAVDFARFSGGPQHLKDVPAVVILVPPLSGAGSPAAFIVGQDCDGNALYQFVGSITAK
jgi:hypothetical protein